MTTLRHWDSLLRTAPDSSGDVEDVPGMVGKTVVRDVNGDAALRRVALAEYVEVGTNSTGKVRFQPGTPTAAGQLQIHPQTGLPYIYIAGVGPVLACGEFELRWFKDEADADPLDDMPADMPLHGPPGFPWTITSASFTPNDGLAAHTTDNATLALRIRNATIGNFIAAAATGVTSSIGSNATGDWTEYVPVPLTLDGPLLTLPIDANDYCTFRITKGNAGVVVPAGVLVVKCRPFIQV